MNRQCYRLVFSQAKGQLVATSELAMASGKSPAEGGRAGRRRARRQPAIAATLAALLLGSPVAQAGIASDPNAPGNQRPTVLETANGVPQVNIQTPSAAGVSRNSYRQFDVSSKGAILNNSRRNTQTQLSGWVQGNPNLTNGEARVILNEVNSRHPSQLRGYLEVAGSRAEVVIANPAGIDVNGAGFINASRATLTTGTPELRNGELTGYRVQQGTVTISGAGLDASGTDYTAILARAVEVQGGVWANDLDVVAGANRIGTDGQVIERLTPQGDAPQVAIDVAHLGGMYAGKITLVATEAGVGVNNAGSLTATQAGGVGDVVLTADGRIVNRGAITAEGDIQLTSQTRIDNLGTGALLAQGDLTLSASGAQGSIRNASGATLAAGVDANTLTLGDNGQLTLSASRTIAAQGQHLAGAGFLAEADTVSLADSETQARDIAVTARRGDINASGATLTARDTLTASAGATLRTDDASVQAERLDLSAADISNRDGELIQAGNDTLHLATGTLDNRGGRVAANADIAIRADELDNAAGTVRAGGTLDVESETLDNRQGQLVAENDLRVSADQLTNTQGLMSAVQGALDIAADTVDNTQGRIEAADGLRLDAADSLTNTAGEIVQLSDGAELQIATTTLQGSDGLLLSRGGLTLQGSEVVLDSARTQAQRIALQADSLSHREGELLHLGTEAPLTLDVTQALDNTAGLIASNADLRLQAGELSNREGTVQAAGDARLTLNRLDNLAGEVVAGDSLELDVQDELDNSQGQLVAESDLSVSANRLDNTQGLMGAVQGSLEVAADTVDNTQGRIEAANGLRLDVADTLTNEAGEIVQLSDGAELQIDATTLHGSDGLMLSQGALTLEGREVVLDGARTQAQRIVLQADSLSHRGGELLHLGSDSPLSLDVTQALDNTQGLIASNADLTLRTGELINREGTVQAAGDALLSLNELDNHAGEVVAGGTLELDVQDELDNSQGQLVAENDIRLNADRLSNAQGLIGAVQGALNANAQSLDNTQGRIEAADGLRLDVADTLTNEAGEIVQLSDGAELQIDATTLHGSDGLMLSQGGLVLAASDIVLDSARTQAQRIALQAASLQHRGGELLHLGGDAPLTLDVTQALDNSAGLIASNADLTLRTGELTNREGTVQAAGNASLSVNGLDNHAGEIVAGDSLELDVQDELDNSQGQLLADAIHLTAGTLVNREGLVSAARDGLSIDSTALDNTQGQMEAVGNVVLTVEGALANLRGSIMQLGAGELQLSSASLANTNGFVAANGDLALQAGSVANRGGTLQAAGDAYVNAASLDNRQGELLSGGALGVTVEGQVDNAQGQLLAQRSFDLQAASLTNTQGAIGTVEDDLTLTLGGTLDNANGSLEAGDELHIRGRELNNQGGTLLGERVTLNTAGRRLDNTAGQIAARDVLTIVSGVLDNTGGTLRSGGDLALDTQGRNLLNLDNAGSGGILANGALVLRSGQLDNSGGLIGVGALEIEATGVTNRNGTLFSRGELTLAATDLDNRSGELLALGDLRLALADALRNQGGLVRSLGLLDIAARRLLNGTTLGDEQGLEGRNVSIVADEIHNRQGAMRADERLDLDSANGIDNRDGLLSSRHTLAVRADDLDNQGGTLIANQRLALALARLLGNGRLLSLGDLALQLASDFTLNQGAELKAAGDLQLATTGALTNRGTLQAGATLELEASTLVNAATGELSGATTRLQAGLLTNRGLIDGVTTRIDATTLDNLGTGRIYGDRLGIQATTLTNQRAGGISPVIAARERLDLGVRNLTNRDEALIFSAGDMAIAGRLNAAGNATGQARRIDNNSATIESLGDMSIAAEAINNTNEYFETRLELVGAGRGR
ncbi:filamentous hemagglutinin N-terminal domain-containing protein [Billgrantia tianxiuensis]|uniref:Filamentous hemagglutinin N-terminal domain-containing protein n=1 Tax=Billgrantia tianxiuensis TaxID=2497861 RepID=A0A6I6SPG4_9GAMM|nr:filamentous hemagglutinin N-terminal domain-containing protein [Halomonas tianxiuensis]QHC48513.1 filamentous hemagglutinin N-terminal domain-containing protein [Halomonas tianxiuensis]